MSEAVGTALLLAAVVGSGIMGDRLTDTFAGIRPADVPASVIAQVAGAFAATWLFAWLVPPLPATAENVLVRHVEAE